MGFEYLDEMKSGHANIVFRPILNDICDALPTTHHIMYDESSITICPCNVCSTNVVLSLSNCEITINSFNEHKVRRSTKWIESLVTNPNIGNALTLNLNDPNFTNKLKKEIKRLYRCDTKQTKYSLI